MGKIEFWDFWEEKKEPLFNLCLKCTGNYHDAQDLLSEVMLKACESVDQQLLETNPGGWLVRLVKNTYIDKYRRLYKSNLNIHFTSEVEWLENKIKQPGLTPLQDLFEKEIWSGLEIVFEKMPPRRLHLTRLYLSGYTYKEICDSYDVKYDALRQMISKSRNELKQSLDEYKMGNAQQKQIPKDIPAPKQLYCHSLILRENNSTHYYDFVNEYSPIRIDQKSQSLKKYLKSHPGAYDSQYTLALMLASQGKIYNALKILRALVDSSYICEKVFDLQIKLFDIYNNKKSITDSVENALEALPNINCKFHVWKALSKDRLNHAEKVLKANIKSESWNVDFRILLIKVYSLQGKGIEAYTECERLHCFHPYHPEIYHFFLEKKIIIEGYKEAKEYARDHFYNNPRYPAACFNHLHFIVSSGNQNNSPEFSSLFNYVRKRCFQYPDFALLKALMEPGKTTKILTRRCADYPECALSKHYLSHFTGEKIFLPPLRSQEIRHLSLVKTIYESIRRAAV